MVNKSYFLKIDNLYIWIRRKIYIVTFVNRLQEMYINLHEKKNKVLNQFMGTFESIANKYSMCELSTVAYKSETQSMQIVQREWQIKCWISIAPQKAQVFLRKEIENIENCGKKIFPHNR